MKNNSDKRSKSRIIKIDSKHIKMKINELGVKITIFSCYIKHHAYTCEQPFDFCPSCGVKL